MMESIIETRFAKIAEKDPTNTTNNDNGNNNGCFAISHGKMPSKTKNQKYEVLVVVASTTNTSFFLCLDGHKFIFEYIIYML
jgi:hypothetical protein